MKTMQWIPRENRHEESTKLAPCAWRNWMIYCTNRTISSHAESLIRLGKVLDLWNKFTNGNFNLRRQACAFTNLFVGNLRRTTKGACRSIQRWVLRSMSVSGWRSDFDKFPKFSDGFMNENFSSRQEACAFSDMFVGNHWRTTKLRSTSSTIHESFRFKKRFSSSSFLMDCASAYKSSPNLLMRSFDRAQVSG